MQVRHRAALWWLCAIGSGLTACGGGGGSAPDDAGDAPASAAAAAALPSRAFDFRTLGLHCAPADASDWIATAGPSYARRVTPRDCLVVMDNPPTFVWPAHPRVRSGAHYRLTVVDADGKPVANAVTEVPYRHFDTPLPAGDYRWQVAVEGGGDEVVSEARRFRVEPQAFALRLPGADDAVSAARAKPRPRLLPRPEAWRAAIASAIERDGARRALFDRWMSAAQAQVGAPLPVEPGLRTAAGIGGAAWNQYMNQVHAAAESLGQSVVRLAVLSHVADDERLRAEAVRRLLHLARWDPHGMTSEALQDQANRQVLHGLAAGYDLLFHALDAADRALVERSVAGRVQQQYDGAFATLRSGERPYDSHGVTGATFAAAATMLMAGISEANDTMAAQYYRWLVPNLLVWGDQDGSDGNGHAYGWFNLVAVQPALIVMDHVAGAPLAHRGVVRNSPLWQAQFTPPPSAAAALHGSPMSFGDGSDAIYAYMHEFHATLSRLWASVLPDGPGRQAASWLWQQHPTRSIAGQQEPLFLLTAPAAPAAMPAALSDAAVFPDAGIVAMHSSLASPTRSSLFFRASRFGTFSHSMADNGSFVLSVGGLPMLVNSGYYDYYWSDHHARYARHTKAKNALTVDGGLGQALDESTGRRTVALSMAAPARLLGFRVDGDRAGASADLTAAYRTLRHDVPQSALLDDYQRSIVYDKARRMAFILDTAGSAGGRTFELNFHAVGPWTTRSDGSRTTSNAAGSICLDVVTRDGSTLAAQQTDRFLDLDGHEVLPTRAHAAHSHLTLSTPAKASAFHAVTVIREDCSERVPAIAWAADRKAVSVTYADGAAFRFGAAGFE
jgi:hypothetical protein